MYRRPMSVLVVAAASLAAMIGGCGPTESTAATTGGTAAALPATTAPWSSVAARDLPAAAPTQAAGIGFATDGSSVLDWGTAPPQDGVPYPKTRLAVFARDGRPGATGEVPRSVAGRPFLAADGEIRLATYRYADTTGQRALALSVVGPAGGAARTVTLDQGYSELGSFDVAVGPRGEMAVAWVESTRYDESSEYVGARIRVAFSSAGSARFGKPKTLADTGRASDPSSANVAVALGPDGRVVVVADAIAGGRGTRGPLVWTGRAGSLRGPVAAARTATRYLDAAVTSTGRAIVAWSEQGGGEEASTGYDVKARSFAPGTSRGSATQTLDRGSLKASPIGGFSLAAGPGGAATLAWTGVTRRSYPAWVASAGADGRFGKRQQLTRNGIVGRLRIRADGAAVVTVGPSYTHPDDEVDRDPDGEARSVAFTRPSAAAAFGPAEPLPLPKGARGQGALLPAPAFDPATGRPSIAYVLAGAKGGPARLVVVKRDRP